MKLACDELAFELSLVNRARHRVVKVMRGVRGAGAINHQREAGLLSIDANDADVLPTTTEKPRRFHHPKRTTHAALIGSR